MNDKSVLLQYTVSNRIEQIEATEVEGKSTVFIGKETVSIDSSIIDNSDEPIKGIPFTFSRCGLSYTPDNVDEKMSAFAPAIPSFSYGAYPIEGGGFLYISFEKRKNAEVSNDWREYYIYNQGATMYLPIIWESFNPEDTSPREPIKQGKTFIEFEDGDVLWVAYSETQWSRKQVLNIMEDKSAIKKRFQKIDVADWLKNNPLSDNEQKIETKVLADKDNPGYHYTYGVMPTSLENVMYSFALNDPLGAADDISKELEERLLYFDGFLASLNSSKSPYFKYSELVNSKLGTYQEYFKNVPSDFYEDQYVSLFNSALVLNSVLLNEEIIAYADLTKNEETIKNNIRENLKYEDPRLGDNKLKEETEKIFKVMQEKYDDMKKYLERISPEKIRKVLGYDARAALRQEIIGLKDSLGQMLSSPFYQNAIIDYYNNEYDACTTGQKRGLNHLMILAQRPWEKETFIQPELADIEDKWKSFINEATDLQDDVFDSLDYLEVDTEISNTVIHTLFLSKAEIIKVTEHTDKVLDMLGKVVTYNSAFVDLLTYSNRRALMRMASDDSARNFRRNVNMARERVVYATQEYIAYDEGLIRKMEDAVEVVKENNKDFTKILKDKKLQKFVKVKKKISSKYQPVNHKKEYIKTYGKILNDRRKSASKKVNTIENEYTIVRTNKNNLTNFLKIKKIQKSSPHVRQYSNILDNVSIALSVYSTVSFVVSVVDTYISDNKNFDGGDFVNASLLFTSIRGTLLNLKPIQNVQISRQVFGKTFSYLGINPNRGVWMIHKGFTLGSICGMSVSAVYSIIMIWDGFTYMKTDNPNKGWVNIAMGFITIAVLGAGLYVSGASFFMLASFNVFMLIMGIVLIVLNYLLSWDPFERFLHNIVFSGRISATNMNKITTYQYRRYLVQYRRNLALPYEREELNYNKDKGIINLSDYNEMYRWMINMMVNLSVTVRYERESYAKMPLNWLENELYSKGREYYYTPKQIVDIRYMDTIPDTRLELKMKLYPRGFSGDKETCLAAAKEVVCNDLRDFAPVFLPIVPAPTNVKGMAYKECKIDFRPKLDDAFNETDAERCVLLDKCRYILYIRLVSKDGTSVWPSDEAEPKYMAISESIISAFKPKKGRSRYSYINAPQGRFYINDKAVYYGTEDEICLQVAKDREKASEEELDEIEKEQRKAREKREKDSSKWPEEKIEIIDVDKELESHKQIMGEK